MGLSDKEEANQLAAESLLDLVNTNIEVVTKLASLSNDHIAYATMEAVVTSPHQANQVKRVNEKKKHSEEYQ